MLCAGRGAFLILLGDSGSGKSTLLHTLGLFREGAATVSIMPSESIQDTLDDLPAVQTGLRLVVIEYREALGDDVAGQDQPGGDRELRPDQAV